MTDVIYYYVAMFFGVVARFGIPFLLKLAKDEITVSETELRYVLSAIATFFFGVFLEYTDLLFDVVALPASVGLTFGFLFGFGGLTLANQFLKTYETVQILRGD